jgi:protein CpxP
MCTFNRQAFAAQKALHQLAEFRIVVDHQNGHSWHDATKLRSGNPDLRVACKYLHILYMRCQHAFGILVRFPSWSGERVAILKQRRMMMNQLSRKVALMGMIASLGFAMPAMASNWGEPGMNKERSGERMAEVLNLSDAQKQQIKAIRSEVRPEMKALGDAMRANRDAMRKLNPDDANYLVEVDKLAAEKGALVQKMTQAHARTRIQIHQVLTPEQRIKAQEFKGKDRKGDRRKQRRNMEEAE